MTIVGAVILAAIAGALMWKNRAPRFVAWSLLFVGIGAAGVIMQYIGPSTTGLSIYGVGIFTIIGIVCAIAFYVEVIKKDGQHKIRTPVMSALLGVSLMSVGGTVGGALNHVSQAGGAQVNKAVTTMFQGGGNNQVHGKNHK